ncbi:MAG TPA: hypothetical protein GXX47_08915 [Firmicutes bacterium]|nr:hypothetical protein [Bacillota bacterium]
MAGKFEIDLKVIIMGIALVVIAAMGSAYITFLVFSRSVGVVSGQAAVEKQGYGPIHEIGEFTVNLMVPPGFAPRFVRTGVAVEVSDKRCLAELTQREAQVRDAVIAILRSKTHDDIAGASGMEKLRHEIAGAISDLLQGGKVVNVFFTDLVVQ